MCGFGGGPSNRRPGPWNLPAWAPSRANPFFGGNWRSPPSQTGFCQLGTQTPAKTFPDTAWNLPGVAESFPSPFTGRLTLLHRFDRRKAFEASGSRPLSSPGLSSSELASRLVLQAPPKGLFLEEAERLEMSALLARSDRPAVKVCPCQNVNACVRGALCQGCLNGHVLLYFQTETKTPTQIQFKP
ncbi:unnamed protein product [Symbiodinium sp. KB8]|nr:unnamed protein product [Symbiodinium sp. KB8]